MKIGEHYPDRGEKDREFYLRRGFSAERATELSIMADKQKRGLKQLPNGEWVKDIEREKSKTQKGGKNGK